MDSKRIAATFVAASAFLSASAIASGYGPAPFYRPSVGVPVSQRGQSEQTVEGAHWWTRRAASGDSYGGAAQPSSSSGHENVSSPGGAEGN